MTREELTVCLTSGMEERGWKIAHLAVASGLAYETVRSAVRGQTSPSLENATSMLTALGRSLTVTQCLTSTSSCPPAPVEASA